MFARVFLIAALAVAPLAYADNLQARLWPTAEKTQLVIETPNKIQYRILRVGEPQRLVLDIFDKRHAAGFLNTTALGDATYLGAVRAARYDDKTLRIVFDIKEEVGYEVRALSPVADYQHRLIMDITPSDHPDPLLSLIESLQPENQQAAARPFRVVIDPGHGGEDPGAVSRKKRYEKNVVLSIARKLREEINQRPGMRGFLTRADDRFLPLAQRVLIAHRLRADAFISIHADSVASPKAHGSSVYTLSARGASSALARRLAKHANLSDLVGGEIADDPQFNAILLAFSKDGKELASKQLAELIHRQITGINIMLKKHVGAAGFAVLKSPAVPSVLVETAFISNPQEERKLHSAKFQHDMATAIADGLQQYRERYHVDEAQ